MALEKTKVWEIERLLVVQQLISEQHDNGISMLFSLKGLRRTRFQIPSIDTFSVTKTTFFRELKRRNLVETAAREENTQETTNIWLENRPKLRLNRKKLWICLSLSPSLSFSLSVPQALSVSLSHSQYQEIILIANAKEKFSQTSSKTTTSATTTPTTPTTATTAGQFKTNFVKENQSCEFFCQLMVRGERNTLSKWNKYVFFPPNNLLGGKRRMVSHQTCQSEFLIRRK